MNVNPMPKKHTYNTASYPIIPKPILTNTLNALNVAGTSKSHTEAPVMSPSVPAAESAVDKDIIDMDEDSDEDIELEREESLTIKERTAEMRERMKMLLENFDAEQLKRYEYYRRSGFPRAAMKRFIQTVIGQTVNANFVIVMSGIAKVFVGEVVEEAKQVMEDWRETGALLPSHIREASRRLIKKGLLKNPHYKKRRF